MGIKIKETKEVVRIKNDSIELVFMSIQGKEGDFFIEISPTLMVSGYGDTEKDARESFIHNVELFCKDILDIASSKRTQYLIKLGFSKVKFKSKKFSKSYIDDKGILQGLDASTIKTSFLETVV